MPDSITLHVHGATEAEIARGESAAKAVFEAANRTPMAAATAFFEVETADEMGTIDDEGAVFDNVGITAWLEAFPAAVAACCEGWTTAPRYTNFIVRSDGEPLPPTNREVTTEIDRLMAMPDAELISLRAASPDTSDELKSLIYWATIERGLNSFSNSGIGARSRTGTAPG